MVGDRRLGDAGQRADSPGNGVERLRANAGKVKHEWHQSGSCGFPRFHRRGDRKSVSFSSHVGDGKRVKWPDQRHITLPSIGTLTLAESLPEVGWVKQVHAVREGGKWYAVLVYENGGQLPDAPGDGPVVGVDVGIKVLAFTSDGEEYDNPRWFRRGERKLRRINKAIARSIKLNPNRRTNRRARLYQTTGTVAIPTGESTADSPSADCIRDSEVRQVRWWWKRCTSPGWYATDAWQKP